MTYNIKVAVLIAVFYMFYRILLSRESLHKLNRIVLLSTAIMSFVLPLCVITIHKTILTKATSAAGMPEASNVAAVVAPAVHWWEIAMPIVFWLGVAATLTMTITSILKVCILISRCEKHPQDDGSVIAVSAASVSPFSWMRYIVLSRSDYEHPDRAILIHEQAHVRLHHSVDVLLVDILTSLQWFNPAMWMLRADLRAVHEYEADAAVLSCGVEARQYQYLLVRKAMADGGYSVANGISHSTLKQRITMMQNKKNNKYGWLRALYVVPVVAVSLIASAKTVTNYKVISDNSKTIGKTEKVEANSQQENEVSPFISNDNANSKETIKEAEKNKVQATADGISTTAEEPAPGDKDIPTYKGNPNDVYIYIAQNLQYPEVAIKNNSEGKVFVRFNVAADGKVSDVQVLRSTVNSTKHNPSLAGKSEQEITDFNKDEGKKNEEATRAMEAEAVRVISSMPAWQPATKDGKPVSADVIVPITFKLQ